MFAAAVGALQAALAVPAASCQQIGEVTSTAGEADDTGTIQRAAYTGPPAGVEVARLGPLCG